jgi:hypothetical protein
MVGRLPWAACKTIASWSSGTTVDVTFWDPMTARNGQPDFPATAGSRPTFGFPPSGRIRWQGYMYSYTGITQVNATTDRFTGVAPVGDSGWSQAKDPPRPAGTWIFPAENVAMGLNISANWSGTLHIEGCDLDSIGCNEGAQCTGSATGVLQLAHVRLAAYDPVIAYNPNATGSGGDALQGIRGHGDAMQFLNGPAGGVRADRCTFISAYQGWIIQGSAVNVGPSNIRNCNWRMLGANHANAVLDQDNVALTAQNMYINTPFRTGFIGSDNWESRFIAGNPSAALGAVNGDFCPKDAVTTNFVSPGYL